MSESFQTDFTLNDFRKHLASSSKMGMKDMIARMPGMSEMIPESKDPEKALKRLRGMIDSMTNKERDDPDIIDMSRRRRIAAGSGVRPREVRQFLKQFDTVRQIRKQMLAMNFFQRIRMMLGWGKLDAFPVKE